MGSSLESKVMGRDFQKKRVQSKESTELNQEIVCLPKVLRF